MKGNSGRPGSGGSPGQPGRAGDFFCSRVVVVDCTLVPFMHETGPNVVNH